MKHLIYDTETTDLIKNTARPLAKQPRMIEFFGLLWDDSSDTEEAFHTLVNPGMLIPELIVGITSITDEMVASAPRFIELVPWFQNLFESADRQVAHNLSYDRQILSFEMERAGAKIGFPPGICTVEATEHLKGHRLSLNSQKGEGLYELLFGEKFEGAHRAEVDVRALFRCYKRLIELGEI